MTPEDAESLQRRILEAAGARRRTPAALLRMLGAESPPGRQAVRRALRQLVAAGELTYTQEFGITWIEASFARPVRVSPRIVISPPGPEETDPAPGTRRVWIAPGAAFGGGRHPTTRLALRGIDHALADRGERRSGPPSRVLDVGTGSGVLVIAAVRLGVDFGLGIDLDPCALAEARANVRRNGLEGRIRMSDEPLANVPGTFSLTAANLRLPTLIAMAPLLTPRCRPDGAIVLSGVRPEEEAALLAAYGRLGFLPSWRETEGGWSGLVLERPR
ncbi:MAG: 50S ribosomal protein L11 methyltransferase [Desulfobacterales bacterium]